MNKKTFVEPNAEFIRFDETSVIATSTNGSCWWKGATDGHSYYSHYTEGCKLNNYDSSQGSSGGWVDNN